MDSSLDDFLDRLAARTPTPGGGGAAAVTGAMAAGLVAMAARFSARQLPDALELAEQADRWRRQLTAMVDMDALVYAAVLEARREGADLREPLEAAARVPLDIAGASARVAQLAARVAAGNPNLRGDAVTGALLAAAAARGAACLVDINVAAGKLEPWLSQAAAQAVAKASDAERRVITGTMSTERADPEP